MPYDAICLQTLHDCAPPWEGRLRRERLIGEVLVPLIAPGGGYLGGKFKKKKKHQVIIISSFRLGPRNGLEKPVSAKVRGDVCIFSNRVQLYDVVTRKEL